MFLIWIEYLHGAYDSTILGIEVHSEFVVEFSWHGWLQEDFHLNVGEEYLLIGFCSQCVCQLRPQFLCLEDMNKFLLISYVSSYAFGNRSEIWHFLLVLVREAPGFLFILRFRIKEQFERERFTSFFIILFVHGKYRGRSTVRKQQQLKWCVPFLVWVAQLQFFRGLFLIHFMGCSRQEGRRKGKASPKCGVKSTITFPGLFSFKSSWRPRFSNTQPQTEPCFVVSF